MKDWHSGVVVLLHSLLGFLPFEGGTFSVPYPSWFVEQWAYTQTRQLLASLATMESLPGFDLPGDADTASDDDDGHDGDYDDVDGDDDDDDDEKVCEICCCELGCGVV